MNIIALRTFPISIEIQWGMHKYRIHSTGALYFAEVYVKIQEVSAVPELLLKQMDSQAATFTFHLVRFPGSCRCLCSHIDAWWYCQCIGGDPVGPWCLPVYIKNKRERLPLSPRTKGIIIPVQVSGLTRGLAVFMDHSLHFPVWLWRRWDDRRSNIRKQLLLFCVLCLTIFRLSLHNIPFEECSVLKRKSVCLYVCPRLEELREAGVLMGWEEPGLT